MSYRRNWITIYDMKTGPSLMSLRMSMLASLSPALFGEGWGDKVWYMDQITK